MYCDLWLQHHLILHYMMRQAFFIRKNTSRMWITVEHRKFEQQLLYTVYCFIIKFTLVNCISGFYIVFLYNYSTLPFCTLIEAQSLVNITVWLLFWFRFISFSWICAFMCLLTKCLVSLWLFESLTKHVSSTLLCLAGTVISVTHVHMYYYASWCDWRRLEKLIETIVAHLTPTAPENVTDPV